MQGPSLFNEKGPAFSFGHFDGFAHFGNIFAFSLFSRYRGETGVLSLT